jgi:hypothetical protein
MLVGNYKIESNSLNVIVSKRVTIKTGKRVGQEDWTDLAYVATIQNALRYLVDLGVRETGLKDLKTIVAKQEELYKLIEGVR